MKRIRHTLILRSAQKALSRARESNVRQCELSWTKKWDGDVRMISFCARLRVGAPRTAFQGKALVGSRPAPLSRRFSSSTSALQPGDGQSDVDAVASHPLSPTSTGSPPRQHRNFNWGQEGTRLAPEEEKKSRSTVPFVVSSTLLG